MLNILVISGFVFTHSLALNVCPEGWKQYSLENSVTKCVKIFYEMANRETAEQRCNSIGNGITLVEIHSKRENDLVVQQMLESNLEDHLTADSNDDYTNHHKPQAWIGITGVPNGGLHDFTFASGCGIKDYSNWAKAQPNNYNNSQDCVFLYTNSTVIGQWNDYQCNNRMYFICQWVSDQSPPCVVSNYYFFKEIKNSRPIDAGVIDVIDAGNTIYDFKPVASTNYLLKLPDLSNLIPINGTVNLIPHNNITNTTLNIGSNANKTFTSTLQATNITTTPLLDQKVANINPSQVSTTCSMASHEHLDTSNVAVTSTEPSTIKPLKSKNNTKNFNNFAQTSLTPINGNMGVQSDGVSNTNPIYPISSELIPINNNYRQANSHFPSTVNNLQNLNGNVGHYSGANYGQAGPLMPIGNQAVNTKSNALIPINGNPNILINTIPISSYVINAPNANQLPYGTVPIKGSGYRVGVRQPFRFG